MDTTNTVAIVFDDHRLFADSFSALIERLGLFRSVHPFTEERELIQFLVKNPPTPIYLFLDYYLKDKTGLPLINEAKRLNSRVVTIVLTSVMNPTVVKNILTYSPNGLVSKSSGFPTILQCLNTIGRGEQYVCPIFSDIVATAQNTSTVVFTGRELEILHYFAKGLSVVQTAEETYLSKHTIVAHRRKMMAKAGVHSITELLAYARMRELI